MAAPQKESQHASAIRLYNPRAQDYNSTHHPAFTTRFHSHLAPYLAPGQKILDLACGTGLLTFLLADTVGPSGRVVGVDVTPRMLAVANDKISKEKEKYGNVELHEHDVLDLDGIEGLKAMKGSFDGITGASMFVLFQDPVEALNHWVAYLKPGGFIALDVPHPQNLVFGGAVEMTAQRMGVWTLYHRLWVKGPESLEEVMGKCEVQVEEMITVNRESGQGDREFGVEEADGLFEEGIDKEICRGFTTTGEVRAEAKKVFREEWGKMAVDGKVMQMDTIFLGIGRKVEAFIGSCRCRATTYTSTALPTSNSFCYCAACRQLSGSGYIPWAQIPSSSLTIATNPSSTLQTLTLSARATRQFCNACGTPLSMSLNDEPEIIYVSMGSIEEESVMGELPKVESHIWLKEKAGWVVVPEDGARRCEEY